jgi:hypothetical protein
VKRQVPILIPALLALVLLVPVSLVGGQTGVWQLGPESPFQYARHDAVFVPGPDNEPWANKIYFLGGRTSSSTELPDIWVFDPVTGVYSDTGADMIQDVSNYNGNLIMDDGTARGPAIYVIGGYDADGAGVNIGMVQRYYPASNMIEALDPADDWPVFVAGYRVGGMGTAAVGDVIYVFGGWESNVPPYFYDGTWAFDPTAPSGVRWTDLGVTLSPGRSYMQSAAQDGKIYSLGGIYYYDGADLVPTDVVEVLDTADPGAGWTALASMPVATAEGRGIGFDSDTLGLNEPGPGYLYVAGGGDWPDGSAEVMEYDIAANVWSQGFPDLINFRSSTAGTFVPLCTSDPDDGLPGMWIFGGRWVSG